jgi:hypothetical protein
MKKIARVSSLLALALAAPGLFALDIPVGEEGGGKFVLDMQAKFAFDIVTDAEGEDGIKDRTWIEEKDPERQAQIKVKAEYDGDNYAFGVESVFERNYANVDDGKNLNINAAWGKYYLLDKQLWFRGGSMESPWRIDTDPINENYASNRPNKKAGVQINFAPSSLTGFNVGLALPVPYKETRSVPSVTDDKGNVIVKGFTRNWGPTYPLMNMVFGLRMNQTIPNLDFGMELGLKGNEPTNGKFFENEGKDEKEGDFQGMDFHFTAVYKFAPVEFRLALKVDNLADGREYSDAEKAKKNAVASLGARVIFDIPNGDGSPLDLGDPWIQLQMLPNDFKEKGNLESIEKTESFKDMEVAFGWEPSYSIVQDQIKAFFNIEVGYRSWAYASDYDTGDEKLANDNPLNFAITPKVEFKFAPSAKFSVFDKISILRQKKEDGFRNELGFRFEWAF